MLSGDIETVDRCVRDGVRFGAEPTDAWLRIKTALVEGQKPTTNTPYAKSFAAIKEGFALAERAYEKLPNHYNEGRLDVYRACRNIMMANDIA